MQTSYSLLNCVLNGQREKIGECKEIKTEYQVPKKMSKIIFFN